MPTGWDTPPTPEEVAAAAPPPPADDPWAKEPPPTPEEVAADRAGRVQRLGEVMLQLGNTDRKAAVLEIARKTGVEDVGLIENQFDFWKRRAELADHDPQRFYDENPELAAIALDQPWLGEIILRDKRVATLQRLLRIAQWVSGPEGAASATAGWTADTAAVQGQKEQAVKDQSAALTGAARIFGTGWGLVGGGGGRLGAPRPGSASSPGDLSMFPVAPAKPGIFQTEAGRSFDAVQLGALASAYIAARASGRDTYEIERQAIGLRNRGVPREYDAGPVEQIGLDAAQFAGSHVVSLGAGGVGGLVAGPPGAAAAGFLASQQMELSNFWDYKEMRDTAGRKMDDQVAMGAAVVYSLGAAAVEVGLTFGPWARALGPLGSMLNSAERKAFVAELMKDTTKQQLFRRVARAWASAAFHEGGEEGIQNLMQDFWGWVGRSASAGEVQPADVVGSLEDAITVAGKATVGAAVPGLGGGIANYRAGRLLAERSAQSAQRLQAITTAIKDSPTAKAAPEVFARMVEDETAASGYRVTAAYVETAAITTLAQEAHLDPVELVRQVAGDEAATRYQEAVATGTRMEIPLQEYVERWGTTGLAQELLPDTATRQAVMTLRQLEENQQRIVEETARLVAEVGTKEDKPTPAEQLMTGIAEQLAKAGKLRQAQVEPQVKLWRKMVRTEAVRNGLDVDQVAQQLVVRIAAANQDVEPVQGLAQAAFHGTGVRDIERMTLSKVGTGTGLAAEGYGIYSSSLQDLADMYMERGAAARAFESGQAQGSGQVYRLDVPEDGQLLHLRESVSAQPAEVRTALVKAGLAGDGTKTGKELYRELERRWKEGNPDLRATGATRADEAASRYLLGLGIKGAKYPSEIAPGGKRGSNFVVWDESAIRILTTLYQNGNAGVRGWLETARQGAQRIASIFLTGKADRSTFLHESAHAFWELKADLAERPGAPTPVQEDLQAALDFMGVKDRAELDQRSAAAAAIRQAATTAGRALTAEEKAQVRDLVEPFERWARGFEAYLMEGRAPSLSLAGAFRRFKFWLTQVYRNLQTLRVELTPEIRGVFDRMLATDAEIAAAARDIGIHGPALEAAKSKAEVAALKEVSRVTESWWQQELRAEREAAGTAYDALPAAVAWRFLKHGLTAGLEGLRALGDGVKLERGSVIAAVGQEVAEKGFRGLLAKRGEEYVHPDQLAAVLGLESGKELLDAMVALPAKAGWVDARAEEAMKEKHPGILEERARLHTLVAEAVHNEPAVVDELHRQWAEDRKKAGAQEAPPLEAVRAAARIIVGRQLVQQVDPRRYYYAERDALRRRAAADAKGDAAGAAKASQERVLAFYLHREALAAQRAVAEAQDLADKLLTEKGQERLGKAAPVYRDVVLRILESLGLVQNIPAESRASGLAELAQTLADQDLEADFDPAVIDGLLKTPTPLADLTVAQLGEVSNALKQIRRAARNRLTVVVAGQRVSLDALAGDIRAEASKLPAKDGAAESKSQRTMKQGTLWTTGQGFLAAMTDPLTTYLDDDYLGPAARQSLRDRYYQQRAVEHELLKLVAVKVVDAFDQMPQEMRARMFEPVDRSMLPLLDGQRRKGKVDRAWMYQVLANLGNQGNLERTLGGRGWTMEQVREFFRVNGLTAEEGQFVQGLWDLNDRHLWPRIAAVHEAVNGTKPGKIEAVPLTLQLADGTELSLRGGYWPAMYDPKESVLGQKQEDVTTVNELNYDTFRASLLKGFTRGRSEGYVDVIRLDDFGQYPAHVLKVVRYIAYEEFVRDAGRILAAIKPTIQERLGEAAFDQLDRWLKVVASGSPDSVSAAERGIVQAAGLVTSRVIQTAMLFNLKNAMADLATPLLAATGPKSARVRGDYLLGALLEGTAGLLAPSSIGRGFWAMRREALEKFDELQIRKDESVRRVREEFERFGAGGKRWRPLAALGSTVEPGRLVDWVHHHGFIFQHVAEVWGTTITAMAMYRQAKAQGADEAEARRRANDVVQKVFSSQLPAEKSAVVRSRGFAGAVMLMQGFFNRTANRTRQTIHPAMVAWANAEGWGEKATAALSAGHAGIMVLGIWTVLNVLGSLLEGRGPEDGEDALEWLKRKLISAPIIQIPLASELAPFVEAAVAEDEIKGKLRFSASERSAPAISSAIRIFKNIGLLADEEREDSRRFWAAYEVAAMALGLPVAQPRRTVPYLADVVAGSEELKFWPLIYGNNPTAPDNPGTFIEEQ